MQSKVYLSMALATSLVLTSCSKLGELTADNFTVTPSPLEEVAGQVPLTINGRFPEKYMKKKAVVTVIPVLRYAGGEVQGQAATFQGEKVQGNDQEISYKLGGNYTMKNTFNYVDAMAKSELYLTFDAKIGKKSVEVPEVKVADGVIATSTLLSRTAGSATTESAQDMYQYAIAQTKEAQIKYLINQSKIRTSELQSVSVQEFVKTLREIKADAKGFQIDGLEVSAYASPDGKTDFNEKLAAKRQGTSTDYVQKELKNMNLDAYVDSKYTAEDWDGFQQLVAASNIQDKDVILRVLNMYEDPEQRETQIRNLSAAFSELADEILPELRRARLTVNYNIIGRSDDEIQAQYKQDASQLSVEELLYAATLTDDAAEKESIYKTTVKQYPSDYRAYNNLAELAYQKGDYATAQNYLSQALSKNSSSAEANANTALVELAQGNVDKAEQALGKATTASNYKEIVGNLNIAKGNYAQAASDLAGVSSNSAALAQILNKDYASAASTLSTISAPDATTSYLKAILSARTGQSSTAISNLKDAIAQDSSLKSRAATDLEFASLFSNSTFQSLVK
ncbi:MAG: tetratricopeptide repeat protein [Bacteroidales bacterium]|nr:tetratricopeptide repeat protein [Bacteroidales bacterium]